MVVVGEAAKGAEALRLVAQAAPDLVVLGFDLARGPNGVEVCLYYLEAENAEFPNGAIRCQLG